MASPHNIMQDLGTNCASFIQLSLSHPLFIDLLPIALHCVIIKWMLWFDDSLSHSNTAVNVRLLCHCDVRFPNEGVIKMLM